jgi:pyruvate kinase
VKRTKIVATLGPASQSPGMVRALIAAGVDVARLNQSHGKREWHERVFATVRAQAKALGKPVAVMVDLQGPKIRVGRVEGGRIELKVGRAVQIAAGDGVGNAETLYTPLPQLVRDVRPGDRLLLDDGALELKVISKSRGRAKAKVIVGGTLSDHKGMNLPGVDLNMPAVTDEDLDNLRWAASAGAEYIAVSFVRRAADVRTVKEELHRLGSAAQVVAKIEKPEALGEIDEIARVADALMVARGDLGVEMALEAIPVAQMRIIRAAHQADIPVIVATQMLDSMRSAPRPTRAEVSDVAGAIFGGADAVMLSGETSAGAYPLESVREMASIAEHAEAHMVESGMYEPILESHPLYAVADAVCHGAYSAARDLGAAAVFVATATGRTALLFSKYRFAGTLVAASHDAEAVRRMALYWGVRPLYVRKFRQHNALFDAMLDASLSRGLVSRGDTIVFVAGSPLVKAGGTNMLLVHRGRQNDGGVSAAGARVSKARLAIDARACIGCGVCSGVCPMGIFRLKGGKASFDRSRLDRCLGDWSCRDACPVAAIRVEKKRRGRR